LSEKLNTTVPLTKQNGGIVEDTVGDIVRHAEGSIYEVAETDQINLVGGNSVRVEEKDSFHVTKGTYERKDGNRKETVEGTTVTEKKGQEIKVNFGAFATFHLSATSTFTSGIHLNASRALKLDYASDRKYDLAKKQFTGVDTEIKQQVYKRPDILKEISPSSYFISGLSGGGVGTLFEKLGKIKPLKEKEAAAETIINADFILIRCGKMAIEVNKDNTIVIDSQDLIHLKGKNIKFDAGAKFTVNTSSVTMAAKSVDLASNLSVKK
jgi:hypothetical protein